MPEHCRDACQGDVQNAFPGHLESDSMSPEAAAVAQRQVRLRFRDLDGHFIGAWDEISSEAVRAGALQSSGFAFTAGAGGESRLPDLTVRRWMLLDTSWIDDIPNRTPSGFGVDTSAYRGISGYRRPFPFRHDCAATSNSLRWRTKSAGSCRRAAAKSMKARTLLGCAVRLP